MSDIVKKIKTIPDLLSSAGATEAQIKKAEKDLKMRFPKEYLEIVREFGRITFGSHEWTGLNINGRLNVVTATYAEKGMNEDFPEKFFVLEDLGIECVKIIVNEKGEAWLLQLDRKKPIAKSISAYLDDLIAEM